MCVCVGAHSVQEVNGPGKIPKLSYLLWIYGTHVLARDEVNSIDISCL